jgi:hypothetical protein
MSVHWFSKLRKALKNGLLFGRRLGRGIIEWMFGILMSVIVGFQVVVPTIQTVVKNLTGTEATIAGLVGTVVTLVILYITAEPLLNRS